MKSVHNQQNGIAPILALIAIVVVGAICTAGYVVYKNNQKDTKPSVSQSNEVIDSFAECVAAGNPIMLSFPEQCAANGKTFTNPDQSLEKPSIEEENWYEFTPATNRYSVRIPDGWEAVSLSGNLYVRDPANLVYKQGTKAKVDVLTEGGWDGPSPFVLYYPEQNYDQIVREGDKQGEIKTTQGLVAQKYKYVETKEQEAIGYQKGDTVYNYYFGADGKYIQLTHYFTAGGTDQSATVERLIKTINVK